MRDFVTEFIAIALNKDDFLKEWNILNDAGFPYFKAVHGVWKGESEWSYIVPVRTSEEVKRLAEVAREHEQEAILHVNPDRSAYLIYTGDTDDFRKEYIGQWDSVSREIAKTLDGYTYDQNTGTYYAVI